VDVPEGSPSPCSCRPLQDHPESDQQKTNGAVHLTVLITKHQEKKFVNSFFFLFLISPSFPPPQPILHQRTETKSH
jgi:hypothetical protein